MELSMKIQVHTPFNLTLGAGGSVHFSVGIHDVNAEVGEHWFTQAHSNLLSNEDKQPNHEMAIAELEALLVDKEMQIAALNKQLKKVDEKPEKAKDGKKSDTTHDSAIQK